VREQEEEPADQDGPEESCVLDAVVCVHFTGANLHRILIDVLRTAGLLLLVPQEVCDEITGLDRKYAGLRQRWIRLQSSRYIRVLPRLEAATAPARVVQVIEDIRGAELEQAIRMPRDLGEVVVVAHCVHLSEQGHEVMALIDDQDGQRIAARWNVPVLTIEDVLTLAIHGGHFPSRADLRQAYGRLRQYGQGLLPLERTGLLDEHERWSSDAASGAEIPAVDGVDHDA
jgi:hypothetical protein